MIMPMNNKRQNALNKLKNNSIFWSRLGFENDPPRYDDCGNLIEFGGDYDKFAAYHKDMYEQGVKLQTSILFSGWVGEDKYDYTLTDKTLEKLFAVLPEDAAYIPRVKLNAPVEWSKLHPEELCVYYGGCNDPEYIRTRVGSLEHDLLGYEAPDGYYMGKDERPNINGFFSNQSFASAGILPMGCAVRPASGDVSDVNTEITAGCFRKHLSSGGKSGMVHMRGYLTHGVHWKCRRLPCGKMYMIPWMLFCVNAPVM